MPHDDLSRRQMLIGSMLAAAGSSPALAAARRPRQGEGRNMPEGFLWGAAVSGHQAEGQNTNSDIWFLEHLAATPFAEKSGDACDHYHRFAGDIALLKALGLNSFRFSLEWARIEPEPGEFSATGIEHYRKVAATCREHGMTPIVTYNHLACPRWFAAMGGWENPACVDLFARYAQKATAGIGDLIGLASTFNEPNIGAQLQWLGLPPGAIAGMQAVLIDAAKAAGTARFSNPMMGDQQKMLPNLLAAHHKARDIIKAGPGEFPVGMTLAISDDQAVGVDSQCDRKRAEVYAPWLEAARQDDYIGVQTYGRTRIDANGVMPLPDGAEITQMGEEFWPQALEQTIRYAHAETGKPVYVTENGVATQDDSRRVAYIRTALKGVKACLDDGLPVKGYVHWSLLDNFEWVMGFRPKFGLVAVDRQTMARKPKPSAHFLGTIARANRIDL